MERPKNFAHFRYVGDKRTQTLYDVDALEDDSIMEELQASQAYICFSPDTPAEARNRGYRLYQGQGRTLAEQVSLDGPGGAVLDAHIARPHRARRNVPAALILHGFPSGMVMAEKIGADLPELGDRMATEIGWPSLCLRFRGCGTSGGNFSLGGWLEDALAGLEELAHRFPDSDRWIIGFGTGGAIGLAAAAANEQVAGAAVLATPADFDDWAGSPDRLLTHARTVGAISDVHFPADMDAWKEQLSAIRAADAAAALRQRPVLVLHGSDDELVPQVDARAVADAHGGADLRIITGAGHQLRHDPRAVSILLGWLDRQQ